MRYNQGMLPDFRVRQRDYLLEISRALTEELDLEVLLQRILRLAIEMLSGHAGFIALTKPGGGWQISIQQGVPEALQAYLEESMAQDKSSINDIGDFITRINKMLDAVSMGLLTGFGLPMYVQKKAIGQIYVFRNRPGNYSANDYSLLNSFANQAAIAVRNASLYKQIKEQNQRMGALLDTVADGILVLNADLSIYHINKPLFKMLNLQSLPEGKRSLADLILWESTPQGLHIQEALDHQFVLYGHDDLYLEGNLLRSGGLSALPVSIVYAPLFADDGSLLNIIASIRDVTRYRTAEEMKSTFTSIISHELKTPIALIKGYASTLRRDDVDWDRETVQESLAVIEQEADHLTAMVEDLLDATRLQSGNLSLRLAPMDLDQIAAELVEKLSTQSQTHTLISDLPHDFAIVPVDELRFTQLLSNLITNSIKYSEGGTIRISGVERAREVQICVSDQGKGFDPMDIPFVFDRFYRSESASKTSKGTGLGLYLCKAIVTAHGGKIWVDETYHEGARICFTLPR